MSATYPSESFNSPGFINCEPGINEIKIYHNITELHITGTTSTKKLNNEQLMNYLYKLHCIYSTTCKGKLIIEKTFS